MATSTGPSEPQRGVKPEKSPDASSRTAGGIGTAWPRVIGNGSGMGYGNHAEDPVWVMCICVTSQRKKHTGALAMKQLILILTSYHDELITFIEDDI